ncbi:hypothetical protein D0T53_06570 [Dysgonomonas sp. 216]|uniref:alpha-2-macroglobulin family protein n=1 Tax=Dysgonomonas sp. 216 TaxID=2302934 RepID=UPI0013D1A92A|nr:alpha-2-macroglobulin family protein [Dysgonomonas sp. 216]NDW18578.1 hypothetical protein [Dysgonomonas sp. 216]
MKKRVLFIILILICTGVQAQTKSKKMKDYAELWIKANKYEAESLPQSAANVVDEVLAQAISEKNNEQIIKALICKNKYKIITDSDDNLGLFSDLENLLKDISGPADNALLHTYIAELYLNYYNDQYWSIKGRTNLGNYIPEDMKEWTTNIFEDKIFEHFGKSVENVDLLLTKKISDYNELIEKGADSKKYYPTLYDFLMKRCIELSKNINGIRYADKPLLSFDKVTLNTSDFIKLDSQSFGSNITAVSFLYIKEYLENLHNRNMTGTIILTELERYKLISSVYGRSTSGAQSLDFLLDIFNNYKSDETCVELINQIADLYKRKNTDADLTQAYDWCLKGIDMYPKYERVNILKIQLRDMERPYAHISGKTIFAADKKDKKLKLEYNNIKTGTLTISKKAVDGSFKFLKTINIELSPKTTYIKEKQDVDLGITEAGEYKIKANFGENNTYKDDFSLYVTNLMVLTRAKGEREYEFYVVNRLNGNPVKDVSVKILKDNKILKTAQTDNKGFTVLTIDENINKDYSLRNKYKYQVSTKNDDSGLKCSFPYDYRYWQGGDQPNIVTETERTDIFTDRSIYRPGQIVYYKCIISSENEGGGFRVIPNKTYEVEFEDSNGQTISESKVTTNEFGSLSGEFTIPKGLNTGTYSIWINDNSIYINVEEYKRPTFQITFDKIDKTYKFGEKITIKGHAENFSGIKIQDAEVEYQVTQSSLWRWFGGNTETIADSVSVTQKDGSFEISFMIPEKSGSDIVPLWRNIYSYNVSATVTDINGETQTGDYRFSVGSVSMILSADIPQMLSKESAAVINIKATNLDGYEISSANGKYTVYKMTDNDSVKTEVLTGEFVLGKQDELKEKLKKIPSGQYLIKLQANDSNGNLVENENKFVLYSEKDKRPAIETNEWWIVKEPKFGQGKAAEIILGISAKDITVLYELEKDNKILQQQQIKYNNENKSFVIPYNESYGENVYACFTYVVNEEVYRKEQLIELQKEEKKLNLRFDVFRDKLRPGQNEEWRISITDNQDKPAFAELLASMYDSSLDKIYQPAYWNIYQNSKYIANPVGLNSGEGYNNLYKTYNGRTSRFDYKKFEFDELRWFGFSFYGRTMRIRGTGSTVMPAAAVVNSSDLAEMEEASMDDALQGRVAGLAVASKAKFESNGATLTQEAGAGQIEKADESQPQIRRDFNETAFFYPHLKTDSNGKILISFTVPESNTLWKFRALAHNKELTSGALEAIAVSRKELMVTPNLPRFMRQGDKASISTKISNLSESPMSGNVRLEFFNPVTEDIIDMPMADKQQTFSIVKDASASVSWTFDVPADIEMIGCRIIAQSENFSDGEQHAISVLPNRMLVTESMAMHVNAGKNGYFTFDKFANNKSKTAENYRLTLEYTANPAWYAVQALPTLSNPSGDDAISWFASYYVNTLGTAIGVQYPKVSAMIKAWKQQNQDKKTLTSDLMKNEELKSVLLEETPWVLDAKDETEQIQQLSLLFDANNNIQKTNMAIDKLSDLQNSDGSWSWFKGFYPSRSITQYILYGFTQLIGMNAVQYPERVKRMQMNAIRFIDLKIREDFEDLKKYNKNWETITSISTNQLEYLYVRSSYRDIPIDQETRTAERFYTSVVEKNWTKLDLYQRSLLVVLLQRNGNKELSAKIMNSLREHAKKTDEMGMFWANNRSHVFMSQSAVATHVFLMDAFKEAKAPAEEMDMLKQWLIKQKQTQKWESTHATIDAIYALLSTGSNWFDVKNESAQITIGGKKVDTSNIEQGTGYIKETWNKGEINSKMANVQISKQGNTPSFGALYWQYFEDLNKISTSVNNGFSVDKLLFVHENGKLNIVNESRSLKVGDKVVVRLVVRTDRDMEFVHLKDMRASCFEPTETLSGNKWQNNAVYYQSTKDASTNFYFDNLPKGTYTFEYELYVSRSGTYSNGITSIQCLYAPEFISHTNGITVTVK